MARITQNELAVALGRSPRQVRYYLQAGMPLDHDSPTCIADCAVWIYLNTNPDRGGWGKRRDGGSDDSGIRYEIREAELAERTENARSRRLRNEETEGNLVDVATVEHRLTEMGTMVRSNLMQLAAKVITVIPSQNRGRIKADIEHAVRDTLSQIYQSGAEIR